MVWKCCVPNCGKNNAEIMMHRFPHKEDENDIYDEWLRNIGRADLLELDRGFVYRKYRVCDRHFEENVKIDPRMYFSKSHLQRGAKPTLFMPRMHSDDTQAAGPSARDEQNIQDEQNETIEERGENVTINVSIEQQQKDASVESIPPLHDFAASGPASMSAVEQRLQRMKSSHLKRGRRDIRGRLNLLQRVNLTRAAQLTPRAKNLYHVAKRLKAIAADLDTRNASLKERLRAARDYAESEEFLATKVNATTKQFLLSQLKLQKKEAKGRRYTLDDKIFALALMKQSPKGYKLLQKVFALPARKTLNQLLRRVPFHCGLNKPILQSVEAAISHMPPSDRYAVLMWDEISLEPGLTYNEQEDNILGFEDCGNSESESQKLTDHATVFMLRGIRRKWKQPLTYFFAESAMSAADLQRNVVSIIRAARDAGIKVIATVSDQMAINCSVIKALHQATDRWCAHNNVENRFCGYLVDGEEVVHLYDPPHLLKCIRNNLLVHKALYKWKATTQQTAVWSDIIHLYEHDSREDDDYKTCNRLTDAHVYPDKLKKMKVKMAAQVFSHRVAAVMHDRGVKGENSTATYCDTSDFLLFFDKLFDSVNGASVKPIDGKYLRTAVSSSSGHLKFWEEALPVLHSIKFVASNGKEFVPPTVHNWEHTIRSLRYLWQKLHREGFEFLCLRNFNQDPLENFFGQIRSHGVRNINPTPAAFKSSFKSLLLNNFTATHAPGSNCEADDATGPLDNLRSFLSLPEVEGVQPLDSSINIDEDFVFTGNQSTLKLQLHAYLAGYVARKLLRKVSCGTCRAAVLSDAADLEEHGLIKARAYNPRSLVYTNAQFRTLFTQSCEVVHHYLPKVCHRPGVGHTLITLLNHYVLSNFHSVCTEHNVLQFFFKLFVRFYIFTWTANVNRILKGLETRDVNDAIKRMALHKCIIRRGRQAKVNAMKSLVQ